MYPVVEHLPDTGITSSSSTRRINFCKLCSICFVILFIQERFAPPHCQDTFIGHRIVVWVHGVLFVGLHGFWDVRCSFYLWLQLGKIFFFFISDYLKFKYNVFVMVIRAKHGHWSYLHFVFLCLTLIWGNFSLIEFLSHYFFKHFFYSFLLISLVFLLHVCYNFCCAPHEVRWLLT